MENQQTIALLIGKIEVKISFSDHEKVGVYSTAAERGGRREHGGHGGQQVHLHRLPRQRHLDGREAVQEGVRALRRREGHLLQAVALSADRPAQLPPRGAGQSGSGFILNLGEEGLQKVYARG